MKTCLSSSQSLWKLRVVGDCALHMPMPFFWGYNACGNDFHNWPRLGHEAHRPFETVPRHVSCPFTLHNNSVCGRDNDWSRENPHEANVWRWPLHDAKSACIETIHAGFDTHLPHLFQIKLAGQLLASLWRRSPATTSLMTKERSSWSRPTGSELFWCFEYEFAGARFLTSHNITTLGALVHKLQVVQYHRAPSGRNCVEQFRKHWSVWVPHSPEGDVVISVELSAAKWICTQRYKGIWESYVVWLTTQHAETFLEGKRHCCIWDGRIDNDRSVGNFNSCSPVDRTMRAQHTFYGVSYWNGHLGFKLVLFSCHFVSRVPFLERNGHWWNMKVTTNGFSLCVKVRFVFGNGINTGKSLDGESHSSDANNVLRCLPSNWTHRRRNCQDGSAKPSFRCARRTCF